MGFWLSRYGLAVIMMIASVVGWEAYKVKLKKDARAEVKTEIIVDSTKEGIKKNDKASKVRERVKLDPSWADRMFEERYCRDCKTGTLR